MEIKTDAIIKDVLLKIQSENKQVDIILRNGISYKGKIENVGQFNVRLNLVGNKSFFDAFIKIEDISAEEVQVRNA